MCASGVTALAMQIRCIDAAREAARLAARGDVLAASRAATLAPEATVLQLSRNGGYVVARVSGRSALLPGLVIVGEAVAATESGP